MYLIYNVFLFLSFDINENLLDLWHQLEPCSTISPFVIDGNTYVPSIIMIIFFLSPFDINGKG